MSDETTRAHAVIVDLGAALGLMVVFEGVETEVELTAAIESRGALGQGWYFHRAMPINDTALLFRAASQAARPIGPRG